MNWQIGYITIAVLRVPNALEQGTKSEVAQKQADRLHHPLCLRDPQRFTVGAKIRTGPQKCGLATPRLAFEGSPRLQSGGQNLNWITSGRIGYITPNVWGPQRFTAQDEIRNGP